MKMCQVALLVALLAAPIAASSNSNCPDVCATQVDARVVEAGSSRRCGFGIRIFGIGGGIFGPMCPDFILTYPSHQECKGDPSPGTFCAPEGPLQVRAERCRCARATVLGTGVLIPSCECERTDGGGHVQDAQTLPCPRIAEG